MNMEEANSTDSVEKIAKIIKNAIMAAIAPLTDDIEAISKQLHQLNDESRAKLKRNVQAHEEKSEDEKAIKPKGRKLNALEFEANLSPEELALDRPEKKRVMNTRMLECAEKYKHCDKKIIDLMNQIKYPNFHKRRGGYYEIILHLENKSWYPSHIFTLHLTQHPSILKSQWSFNIWSKYILKDPLPTSMSQSHLFMI